MHFPVESEMNNCDIPVEHRARKQPTRQRLALTKELSGARKLANRARHRRSARRTAPFNGAHRRRSKRVRV